MGESYSRERARLRNASAISPHFLPAVGLLGMCPPTAIRFPAARKAFELSRAAAIGGQRAEQDQSNPAGTGQGLRVSASRRHAATVRR